MLFTSLEVYKIVDIQIAGVYEQEPQGPRSNVRPTHRNKTGRAEHAQNSALRIFTGCHKMANEHHLHRVTKLLPVKEHSKMLAARFDLQCHQMLNQHLGVSEYPQKIPR